MAFDNGKRTLEINDKERTYCIEIQVEVGADPIVVVRRERVGVADDGTVVYRDRGVPVCSRRLSDIASTEVNGRTGAQMAGDLQAWADFIRQSDIDEAAASPAS